MKRLLAAVGAWLFTVSMALAQIPPGVIGMNYGGDPTITTGFPYATGVYPVYTTFDRIYDSIHGVTAHTTWWSTLNPTAGNYLFTTLLDPILAAEAARGKTTEYTLSGVPAYVNGSQKVSGGTQLTQFGAFLTAMMTHVAGNHQCFGYFSIWNEANQPSTYWTGTASELAALAAVAYPIIKASCPNTVVLTPSVTSGVDSGSSPFPNGPFQYLAAYLAAGGAAVTDACNAHGYPEVPSLQTANPSVTLDPFLLVNTITSLKAICAAAGLSVSSYLDEGYACSDPASTTFPANTNAYAACQASQLVISAMSGIKSYANSFFGDGCTIPFCGNEYAARGPLKLTTAGLMKRNLVSWFSGATVSSAFTRTLGTNLITVAPNDASVATGALGGSTGVGCASPPGGTGSLPVGASPWALSASASIAGGLSYYVAGDGTSGGLPYIDTRVCGTDGSGAHADLIRMNNFTGAATQGQNVVIAACLGLVTGTLNGISEIDLFLQEFAAGPSALPDFMSQGQIQPVSTTIVPITQQCYQTRYVVRGATAAFIVPSIVIRHYGSIAIDATFRVANPHLDVNATHWSGVVTKPGGYSGTIVADASGAGTITAPSGTVDYRDIYGNVRRASAGQTIRFEGNAPILIESVLPKAWLPGVVNAFVVAPSMGGSDSFPGTITQPFATLPKCHAAMQASSTTKLCYIRGAVTAARWNDTVSAMGSNETWRNYPGDPPYSTNITITGAFNPHQIGCTSCSNLTIYGLVINGTGNAFNLFGFFSANNVFIRDNHITNTSTQGTMSCFNWNNFYVQGNAFVASTTSTANFLSCPLTDGLTHTALNLTDNTFNGSDRIAVELQSQNGEILTNSHVDRNTFTNWGGGLTGDGSAQGCISWVGSTSASNSQNTLYGNQCLLSGSTNSTVGGYEIGLSNTLLANNVTVGVAYAFTLAAAANSSLQNNNVTIPIANTAANPTGPLFYGRNGGGGEWVGTNTVTGSSTNSVTGCTGSTASPPPVSPGYCGIFPAPTYGAAPPSASYLPSPVWSQ